MMKTLIVTTLMLCSFCFGSFAQVSLDWLKTIQSPSESGGSIAVDNANNSYAAAVGGNTTYLTKRNKTGATAWSASGSTSYQEGIVKAFVDPQGNPVVTGFQYYNTINGKVVVGLLVRKFTPAGDSIYRKIIPGFYTNLDGGDIEHPGNNQSKVTAVMDKAGYIYFGTGGIVDGGGIGFNMVRVSPSGNVVHISKNNFGLDTTGSASPFYYVDNITVKGNRVGLTGSTKIGFQNITTWVLDTAGTTLWSDISNGIEGRDIAFDNQNNTYVTALKINAAGPFTSDDITLIKFNSTGTQLLTKAYDFGGAEISSKMILTPDNKLVIMASGTGTSTLGFSDWLIVKLSLNGNLLWNYRYNESNYDEIPGAIVSDGKSNVYVTGSGGPDTGDFLYGLYGVTLKLTPGGLAKWISIIHLENFTPVDLALGKDTSVFVISQPGASVAHLIQKSKSSNCAVPVNLQASFITNNSAVLSWKKVPDVFLYELQYKTSTSSTWTQVKLDSNHYSVNNLLQGTSYDFRVQAICAVGPSGFSTVKTFVTSGAGYCASSGSTFNNIYMINWVQLGQINHQSSAEGYGDFTNLSANLQAGSTYNITTGAYVIGDFYNEAFSIWIDYNKDGDFTDAGELVSQFTQTTNGYTIHSFTVPTSATPGVTRMRVSMKHGGYSTPCEIFQNGEVEDYTINILPLKLYDGTVDKSVGITTMPNPAGDFINVSISGFDSQILLVVYDVSGKIVLNEEHGDNQLIRLDVSHLHSGVYFVHVSDERGNRAVEKWMKE